MGDTDLRYRLVVLGAGKVGKSSIISRFLHGNFAEKYRETIEDLHCREYEINGNVIKVDILDTAGSQAFPAMRRLSISTAHAFLLVYSIDDSESFDEIKQVYEQIREQKSNYQDIPLILVGNKTDLESERQVSKEYVDDHIITENWHGGFIEVSARDNSNILDIFQKLLHQANVPAARQLSPILRRRMSERTKTGKPSAFVREPSEDKMMRRSRSLIRRSSKSKMKHNGDQNRNDCVIS
ncbi:ras-related protein Rap-2b-like [Saccoglossus kowalevskii]|uniref:GTP-binding protein Rhes-like n=1 Tax=Saccoglossus kowalevskii TaxID=10224 RepID=A0ABM0GMS1_SACKO|nr:PREDICTED: GTP-binding protein Rhes-like [Saccoglossus kowalevskii]